MISNSLVSTNKVDHPVLPTYSIIESSISEVDKRMINEVLDTWDNNNRKMIPKGEVFFAAAELNTKNPKFF